MYGSVQSPGYCASPPEAGELAQQKRNLAYVKKLLIVDDSPAIRRSLRMLLEKRPDWEICGEAENGREGIDKAILLCPDLILLDLSMPVMNGFQAARELHRLLPKVPLLMFTSFGSAEIEDEAMAAGIAAVKSKSDGLESLCGSIQELLNAA
jgi:DNA-binding NarL/FixJ family response regulator